MFVSKTDLDLEYREAFQIENLKSKLFKMLYFENLKTNARGFNQKGIWGKKMMKKCIFRY